MTELGDVVAVDATDVDAIRAGVAAATKHAPRRAAGWAEVAARTLAVYEEIA
jgi:hypothetical protein